MTGEGPSGTVLEMRLILKMAVALLLLPVPVVRAQVGAEPVPVGRAQAATEPVPARAAVETRFTGADDRDARDPSPEHGKAFTGDATPVEPGRIEVEFAYAPTWWATAGAVDRIAGEQHAVAAAVTVGVMRDVDARLVVGWTLAHAGAAAPGAPVHGQGISDTTVAGRWRFLSLREPPIDLAFAAAVTVPTGLPASPDHLATGRGAWSAGGAFLASGDWGPFTAGLELGFSAVVGQPAWNDAGLVTCNLAVGWQALPWVQPELELNYQHEIETGGQADERVLWATAAAVLPLDPIRVVLGARLPVWTRDTVVGPTLTAAVKASF